MYQLIIIPIVWMNSISIEEKTNLLGSGSIGYIIVVELLMVKNVFNDTKNEK